MSTDLPLAKASPFQRWKRIRRGGTAAARPLVPRSDPQPSQRYFTDGSDLYRFAGWLTRSGNSKLAALEDCRTLRILLVSADYLRTASLRPVGVAKP